MEIILKSQVSFIIMVEIFLFLFIYQIGDQQSCSMAQLPTCQIQARNPQQVNQRTDRAVTFSHVQN